MSQNHSCPRTILQKKTKSQTPKVGECPSENPPKHNEGKHLRSRAGVSNPFPTVGQESFLPKGRILKQEVIVVRQEVMSLSR